MSIRPIVTHPAPILREIAEHVDAFGFDPSTPLSYVTLHQEEVQDMQETLAAEKNGAALAANQIGIKKQVFVISPKLAKDNLVPEVIINPRFIRKGNTTSKETEGCLSFPGIHVEVERPRKVEVEYETIQGTTERKNLSGFISRVFQHEMDHLDGILFIDHKE